MNPERAHELRPRLILVAIAVACVIVPYLTWRQTWFGRRLSQAEVGQYLGDEQHPRKIQHALTFLGQQMARADPSARLDHGPGQPVRHSAPGAARPARRSRGAGPPQCGAGAGTLRRRTGTARTHRHTASVAGSLS